MPSRCEVCDHSLKICLDTGPVPCEVLAIGEKPGQEEAARGRVLVGDTGRELNNTYLPLAGLWRPDIRATNTIKCRLGGNNNKPTEAQVRACARHWIPDEIDAAEPQVIILMGATACGLVPKIDLQRDHGMPVWVDERDSEYLAGWSGWVWPVGHPAKGLHETGEMVELLEDFERFRKWGEGKWKPPVDRISKTDYRLLKTAEDLRDQFILRPKYEYLPVDTENDGPDIWSVQFSTAPGNGFMIRADRHYLLEMWWAMVRTSYSGLLLHNAIHDLDELEKVGIRPAKWRDTMQESYHLGNLPQGLKHLAHRLLGVEMQSWEDLVMPHSRKRVVEWLLSAWDWASDRRERVEKQMKTKVRVEYKPSQLERGLKRILSHSEKVAYDIWEKVGELGEMPEELGRVPRPSIAYVPVADAVRYGCRDADIAGRLGRELESIREKVMGKEWKVEEEDRDI